MENYVKVTLTISVSVDAEFSATEHADDIIENTKRLFPAAEVTVLEVATDPLNGPKPSAPLSDIVDRI